MTGIANDVQQEQAAPAATPVRCENCIYWQPLEKRVMLNAPSGGLCKRNPPTALLIQGVDMTGKPAAQIQPAFPPTLATDWCGEFQDSED